MTPIRINGNCARRSASRLHLKHQDHRLVSPGDGEGAILSSRSPAHRQVSLVFGSKRHLGAEIHARPLQNSLTPEELLAVRGRARVLWCIVPLARGMWHEELTQAGYRCAAAVAVDGVRAVGRV